MIIKSHRKFLLLEPTPPGLDIRDNQNDTATTWGSLYTYQRLKDAT